MTRSLPGAEQAILGRLVVRQDAMETALVQIRGDVDRLTRATTALTDALRKLPTTTPGTPGAAASSAPSAVDTGQRDWLGVSDPGLALEWLVEVTGWWEQIGSGLVAPAPPCWPWHPRAVIAALALQAHYAEAYAGDKASPVSDLIIRWVPALGHMVVPTGSDCSQQEHWQHSRAWTAHLDQLPDYAHWWATDRTGRPPGLEPRS